MRLLLVGPQHHAVRVGNVVLQFGQALALTEDARDLLETADKKERLEKLYSLLKSEIEILEVERKIRSRVRKQMEKSQKEYFLNEQMKEIRKELGSEEEEEDEEEEDEQQDAPVAEKPTPASEFQQMVQSMESSPIPVTTR